MLVDKYCRLRTDMEDMIEAHQELTRSWQVIKDFYELKQQCPPSVCFDVTIKSLYDTQKDLLSALVRAKNWVACDEDNYNKMTEHDQETYNSTMIAINQAINKATQ